MPAKLARFAVVVNRDRFAAQPVAKNDFSSWPRTPSVGASLGAHNNRAVGLQQGSRRRLLLGDDVISLPLFPDESTTDLWIKPKESFTILDPLEEGATGANIGARDIGRWARLSDGRVGIIARAGGSRHGAIVRVWCRHAD